MNKRMLEDTNHDCCPQTRAKKGSSTVYTIKPELSFVYLLEGPNYSRRFSCFPSRRKPGSRGGSARVPVAEASPCAPKKGRAVAAKRPPGGERSVCGMSGRPIAAAPQLFVENFCMPHTGMSAPRMTVFLANIKPTAQKVAIGDAIHYLEADVRLARDFSGTAAKTPPAPSTSRVLYPVAGI